MFGVQLLKPLLGARIALAVACALSVSGCTVSRTLSSASLAPEPVSASVANTIKTEGIDSTDTELIKQVVAQSEAAQTSELAWSNPDTGNKGTIMAIDKFVGSHGQKCKKFETTVDSFMGISIYNGETCELRSGFWVLSWFLRKEA